MQFVRMNDDHLPRQRSTFLTAITEGLYATHGQTDGVGVVPVRCKAVAVKPGVNALDPLFRWRYLDPVHFHFAQTFKTTRLRLR